MSESRTRLRYGAVDDATDLGVIKAVEQATHDQVLEDLAGYKREGVRWYHVPASDLAKCREVITMGDRVLHPDEEKLLAYLEAAPAGLLIVAACTYEAD